MLSIFILVIGYDKDLQCSVRHDKYQDEKKRKCRDVGYDVTQE